MKKMSRNDNCWCGSGKKYKKCHMKQDEYLKKIGEYYRVKIPRDIIKTPEQIDGIRTSGVITHNVLDLVGEKIKIGMTTEEINTIVHEYTVENGGIPAPLNYNGFPKSVCTSINEVICHGIPCDRELKDGDIINVDVTTILNGYFADSSRMYYVGEVDEKAKKIVEVSKEALYAGIEAVKPFGFTGDIGAAVIEVTSKHGFSVVHEYGGHGVGVKFHEEPFISHVSKKGEGMIMLPGMVFTIEPMLNEGVARIKMLDDDWTAVTRDGKLSSQWEHTIVVTENGYEILT